MTQKWYKRKRYWFLLFLLLYIVVIYHHQQKSLPENISYNGKFHDMSDDEIEFLFDLTYQDGNEEVYEQEIFDEIFNIIEEAETFLILDFFLVNDSSSNEKDFPPLSKQLSNKILQQLETYPDLQIIFITDPINTTYHSHSNAFLEALKDAGVEVIFTDLKQLRDPNPLYSAIWRIGIQWFGQKGTGWITNPLGNDSPKVTARSYLNLLNVKANHRKVVISEKEALITSANPHDASGYHSNIAFKVSGDILKEIIETERAVVQFSDGDLSLFPNEEQVQPNNTSNNSSDIQTKVVTEQQIQHAAVEAMDQATKGDTIWIGMFYLADRDIIDAITDAAAKGVKIRIILDPNQEAFGSEKSGLPNIPVARELLEKEGDIQVKWYNVNKEQYHTKLLFVKSDDKSYLLGGSANFTSRNLDDYNLETNIYVKANNDTSIVRDVQQYFNRLWDNQDAIYTVDYETYSSLTTFKKLVYRLQKITKFTTY
ncbi:HKD family nuclease [Gracilibacillus halotolerans]|uniref:HKD family nuclease n=1 Tax=Gracilibacillus halotolerans TaxID=74386 RepID=A0A841RP83_9BACI|nr:phospholipase D family protein [Gracilibacillus halotolerans]MBB6512468.1 HKD family nuclease [Gracilibacillus halotolerans]